MPPPLPPPPALSLSLSNHTGQATSGATYFSTSGGTSELASSSSCTSLGGTDKGESLNRTETASRRSTASAGGGGGGGGNPGCGDDGNGQKKKEAPPSKLGVGGAPSAAATAYVPVHGLLFFLGDLHMKTPEEILEKAGHWSMLLDCLYRKILVVKLEGRNCFFEPVGGREQ